MSILIQDLHDQETGYTVEPWHCFYMCVLMTLYVSAIELILCALHNQVTSLNGSVCSPGGQDII